MSLPGRKFRKHAPGNNYPIPEHWQVAAFAAAILFFWYCLLSGDSLLIQILDLFNLMVHEGGHTFFHIFGQYASLWGGTLLQLMFPAGCLAYFIHSKQPTSAALCGVWIGQNITNIATYMADANVRQLDLVGGGLHDWLFIFDSLGLLQQAERIGAAANVSGWLVMFASAGWNVWRWMRLRTRAGPRRPS